MIILNYLLAISLVILSVVKTAGIFITSSKSLEQVQKKFITQTRSLLNKKGSVSLVAAVLTSLLSLLLLFFTTKMHIEYKEALYRKESYLCLHYLNKQTVNYINEMAQFNWGLRTAFIAQASIIGTAQAIAIFKALVIARNLFHFYYIKKISFNKFCKIPETLSYLKNTPFQMAPSFTLITNIDQTTRVRKNKWTYTLYKNPQGIRLKKSFCLQSTLQIQNAFIPKINLKKNIIEEEFEITGLSSWKCSSGFL